MNIADSGQENIHLKATGYHLKIMAKHSYVYTKNLYRHPPLPPSGIIITSNDARMA